MVAPSGECRTRRLGDIDVPEVGFVFCTVLGCSGSFSESFRCTSQLWFPGSCSLFSACPFFGPNFASGSCSLSDPNSFPDSCSLSHLGSLLESPWFSEYSSLSESCSLESCPFFSSGNLWLSCLWLSGSDSDSNSNPCCCSALPITASSPSFLFVCRQGFFSR